MRFMRAEIVYNVQNVKSGHCIYSINEHVKFCVNLVVNLCKDTSCDFIHVCNACSFFIIIMI